MVSAFFVLGFMLVVFHESALSVLIYWRKLRFSFLFLQVTPAHFALKCCSSGNKKADALTSAYSIISPCVWVVYLVLIFGPTI